MTHRFDYDEHISVDLDSTLFDTRHRQGMIEEFRERGEPVDWVKYSLACEGDSLSEFGSLLLIMQRHIPWHVVSGRTEESREATMRSLHAHGLKPRTVNLEDDPDRHTGLGHVEWKALRVAELAKQYPIVLHVDDYPGVALRISMLTLGRVKGVTMLPPGWLAVPNLGSTQPSTAL